MGKWDDQQMLKYSRAFLDGKVGVIETARSLSGFRDERQNIREILTTFITIDSETDTFPLGKVRDNWNKEALVKIDKEIEHATNLYRDDVTEACRKLITALEVSV